MGCKVNPKDEEELMQLGFSKAQVEEALSICDGNKEHAATYLMNQSQAQGRSPKR